jgi:ketosteroid isomerase-like protein
MSQENIEVINAGIAAFNRRDQEAAAAVLHPAVEFDAAGSILPGMNRVYRGHAGVRRFWQTWLEDLGELRFEIDETIDSGEHVFVVQRAITRGRSSGAEVEQRWFTVYTFRDGLIVRLRGFGDRQQALEAAGLSE